MGAMHEVILSAVRIWAYAVTLAVARIKLTKAIISFRINIKLTRPTNSTSRVHQVYMISQNLQKRYGLPGCLVATISKSLQTPSAGIEPTQGYSTTKKSEPKSFGFFLQFPTRVGRFFIWLICYLFSSLSYANFTKPFILGQNCKGSHLLRPFFEKSFFLFGLLLHYEVFYQLVYLTLLFLG